MKVEDLTNENDEPREEAVRGDSSQIGFPRVKPGIKAGDDDYAPPKP